MDKFLGFKTDEILTCLLLIVVGYVIAKMFNGCSNNGFSVGIQRRSDGNNCVDGETCNAGGDTQYRYPCPGGGQCYNLVIDDGNVIDCINPEGVYGDSNDTYCIQDELPDPNIPVDCKGHWEDPGNCDINCERKYVVDTPASNGGIQCDDIGQTKKCKKLKQDTMVIKSGEFYYIDEFDTLNDNLMVNGTLCINKQFNINNYMIYISGTLNIQSNGTLNILSNGNIKNNGSIDNGVGGVVNNKGYITNMLDATIYNSGTIYNNDGTIDNTNGNITNRGTIDNANGTICGNDIKNNKQTGHDVLINCP